MHPWETTEDTGTAPSSEKSNYPERSFLMLGEFTQGLQQSHPKPAWAEKAWEKKKRLTKREEKAPDRW